MKVKGKPKAFKPRDKKVLSDLSTYIFSFDFNTPCDFCLYEYECLYTENYCTVCNEFWELWQRFEESLKAFSRKIAERRKES